MNTYRIIDEKDSENTFMAIRESFRKSGAFYFAVLNIRGKQDRAIYGNDFHDVKSDCEEIGDIIGYDGNMWTVYDRSGNWILSGGRTEEGKKFCEDMPDEKPVEAAYTAAVKYDKNGAKCHNYYFANDLDFLIRRCKLTVECLEDRDGDSFWHIVNADGVCVAAWKKPEQY